MSDTIKVRDIKITICVPCLEGRGSECHTPECAFFLHRVDLPVHPELYEVMHEFDSCVGGSRPPKAEG